MHSQAALLLASQDTLIIQRNFIKILAFRFESYLLIYGKSICSGVCPHPPTQ